MHTLCSEAGMVSTQPYPAHTCTRAIKVEHSVTHWVTHCNCPLVHGSETCPPSPVDKAIGQPCSKKKSSSHPHMNPLLIISRCHVQQLHCPRGENTPAFIVPGPGVKPFDLNFITSYYLWNGSMENGKGEGFFIYIYISCRPNLVTDDWTRLWNAAHNKSCSTVMFV